MIDLLEVANIQRELVANFGGLAGVRDMNLLASCLRTPFLRQNKKALYAEPAQRATALLLEIRRSKPFVDANSRMAYLLPRLLLLAEGFDISASPEERTAFMAKIRGADLQKAEVLEWFSRNIRLTR